MSDDSSDCSDMNIRPSGSRSRQQNCRDQKRKSRIVMRIEFDDSDDSSSASDRSSNDDDIKTKNKVNNQIDNDTDDDGPSCSVKLHNRLKNKSMNHTIGNNTDSDSDEFQNNAASRRLRLRERRINVLDVGFSDDSTSGSEITRHKKSRGKKYIVSEEERELKSPSNNCKNSVEQNQNHNEGFTSDSSSNDLLEKCPICLLSFRQQEIGSPSTCDHIFCANCIEAWSKNVQTCPIDRIEFQHIIVRESYENRSVVREINVDPNAKKGLILDDDLVEEEDVTNCEICNRPDREDIMLLCDYCNQGYHMDCLTPALSEVPAGSWYCDNCVDSQDDEDDEEDLNMLFEDIRDMGIPESRLRVRQVQQPRILRTRQNERIRAAIIRRTRAVVGSLDTTANNSTTQRGRCSTSTTITTTTRRSTVSRNRSVSGTAVRKTRRRKKRRARQRTYVVEYDLNNFDEKFAIKTTKKVIKRRRRRRKVRSTSKKGGKISSDGFRMTASKRLAEQMGVKQDPTYTSRLSGSAVGLSLFGGANDLEYFSDSDNGGNIESEIHIETGHGTAVETSVRISNYGSQRSRKALLLGRLQPNHGIQEPRVDQNNYNPDILSSIMNMQDRWHNATRNLESVHINSDGTLNLPNSNTANFANKSSNSTNCAKQNISKTKQAANGPSSSDINQAPLYSRGGGHTNFNRGGGGYNNRSNNQNNYRGGGGGGNPYRHSTGSTGGSSGGFGSSNASSSGGINFNMIGRGNFNFSNNPNYNGPQSQQNNMSPFQQRNFNQRNQQNPQQNNLRNNNTSTSQQRHSLPFSNNCNDNMQQQQQQQILQQNQINPYGAGRTQVCLPPPPTHLLLNQQSQQNLQTQLNDNSLFGGLPPPMSMPPPHINVNPPARMSIPPPPAPPPVVIPPPVNNSLFQLNSDYCNNDDDSNCPNFSIYSHESLQVAKSSEIYSANTSAETSNTVSTAKEDDGNEDLVQLDDDDDEIPMPPGPNQIENVSSSELYEPENPTEENDDDNSIEMDNKNDRPAATKDDGDDYGDDNDDDHDKKKSNDKDKKELKQNNSEKYNPEEDISSECSNSVEEIGDKNLNNDDDKRLETVRSPSPAISEIRLPEIETVAANRKGVLELYDDSDWEELDIDRPKENDNKIVETNNEVEKLVEEGNEDNENIIEQDRSYTPCLDENNEPEDPDNEGEGTTTPLIEDKSVTTKNDKNNEKSDSNIKNMDTELISDEEDEVDRLNKDRKKNKKNNDKRNERREKEKGETFKKIGNKQKGRNYRGDKQPLTNNRRNDKKRKSRSMSRSRSRSRSRSLDSFHLRGGRSRSRSPRFRGRGDRSRSRSRSNNKENQGRFGGNFRDGSRFNRNNISRLKRRELPRYDVRNVVGHHSPPKTVAKDRYGRDTSRNRRSSRSLSRGRRGPPPKSSFSRSRSRNRRLSISLSPTPSYNRRRSLSHSRPTRNFSPVRRRSTSLVRRTPPYRQRSRTPLRAIRSRSISGGSEHRLNGRKVSRHFKTLSPVRSRSRSRGRIRSRSISVSPRYTPRLSRCRSKTPRPKTRKKKIKESRKKKKRRIGTMSPSPNRRIIRQADPFEIEKPPKKKRRRSPRAKSPIHDDHGWSPSPSPPPQPIVENYEYQVDKNVSWTPPMQSPVLGAFERNDVRSVSRSSRKEKNKRNKKKKKTEKRRKEKKRKRRTETPEPVPSKEVFASGNNILVSVSFNKETTTNQQHAQQTIVTLPPNREDVLTTRRSSVDRVVSNSAPAKKRKEKRKKIDTKPVAIIDLERSPFQIEQEPTDVIVLTDSEETIEHEQRENRRDRHHSESCPRDVDSDTHRNQRSGVSSGQRGEKSPEHLDTILEESYDLPQSGGPKTPPEPPVIKFNLQSKKQSKVRNPLHEEDDLVSDVELNERQQQQQQENHRSDLDAMHGQSNQKIGPNTPPESGPCSPDAYDPFEPTKSPSISPRSPTPPPSQLDVSQNTLCVESTVDLGTNQKHLSSVDSEQRREHIPGLGGNVVQGASINPVELVMALINSKSAANNAQDLANKANESQHINNMGGVNTHDDAFRDKTDEGNAITVLSSLLISSGNMQHIPSISSPTPPTVSKKNLPGLPKMGGSVGGSSSSGVNIRNGGTTSNNADDSFNINDIESPYSPGSADYEDLFEPPPDTVGYKRRSKRPAGGGSGKPEMFDNLFGSSSPIGNVRLHSHTPSKKYKSSSAAAAVRKSKIKVGKTADDNLKIYDDVPNSAVELQVKDRFLRKLNRQERVVEEVKLVLKPRFNRKQITKEDYKEIMRRAVPKICHSRSGEIDPFKIKKLIEAYVKKFRAKHKKLNIVNTGQVSSAVKCAAYLKKL